jgi:hypothetical protein
MPVKRCRGLVAAAIVAALAWRAGDAVAEGGPAPIFAADFAAACVLDEHGEPAEWHVSDALRREDWASRIRCVPDEQAAGASRVLRITVEPGDAYDPNPADNATERAEIQVRRELVKFETPVWYSFRFRLVEPWGEVENRTVIHQIKQNIEPALEEDAGGPCPAANPFLKIEARGDPAGALFMVKTRGTADCRDGKAGVIRCGPWTIAIGQWHRVHVFLRASQSEGETGLRIALDGRACPPFAGKLGYLDHGKRDAAGRPVVDTQPRFGIYRDALPELAQSIEFADIAFWTSDPSGDPAWAAIRAHAEP